MKIPFLSESREEWQVYVCGHQFSPDALHCNRDATWHGFAIDEHGIKATMASCDQHRPDMERVTDYIHPLVHPCGIPGSRFRWPENECFTEWDEHAVFTQALALAGAE